MKRFLGFAAIGLSLVVLSFLFYMINYVMLRDVTHILDYFLIDLGFLPLEVFLVVMVVERLLALRAKRSNEYKLNMVVGVFFSEVGTKLLADLARGFDHHDLVRTRLNVSDNWTSKDFRSAIGFANSAGKITSCDNLDLDSLKDFLLSRRDFLLRLLENQNILEHDRFAALLWAIFHLAEELAARQSLKGIPESELTHLAGDIQRAIERLIPEWLLYMSHLQSKYPYLFSFACRTHPMRDESSPVLKPTSGSVN